MKSWLELRSFRQTLPLALGVMAGAACSVEASAQLMTNPLPMPPAALTCSGCHGGPASSAIPPLNRMDASAILGAMQAFRAGTRPATVMDRIARGFDDAELQAMALWFAAEPKP